VNNNNNLIPNLNRHFLVYLREKKIIISRTSQEIHLAMTEQRKAVIKNADMSEEMQQDAVDIASQALAKYNIEKVRFSFYFPHEKVDKRPGGTSPYRTKLREPVVLTFDPLRCRLL
jgi:hypothetical protein